MSAITPARTSVPIPPIMSHLPLDPRGYPIPWIVLRDAHKRPHFTINDAHRVAQCARHRLCGICGKHISHAPRPRADYTRATPIAAAPDVSVRGAWFVGGPVCFLSPHGAFLDPPMHYACAVYALKVCPDTAITRSASPARAGSGTLPGSNDRPPLFMLAHAHRYVPFRGSEGTLMFRVPTPERDWSDFQLWENGARVPATPERLAALHARVAAMEATRRGGQPSTTTNSHKLRENRSEKGV